MPDPGRRHRPARLIFRACLAASFLLICGLPYVGWLDHPSLFHDDFMRVWSLRNASLGEALFRPFNEHMAPLFELVSYLAWLAAGRDTRSIPTTFMAASFLALSSTAGMLGLLVRRETRSTVSGLVAVTIFCLSSASSEAVLWYSACSFQWAAAATLAALFSAAQAADSTSSTSRRGWLLGSVIAAMAAPAFSAVGILAAPVAALRLLLTGKPGSSTFGRLARAAIPSIGLAIYLSTCAAFRYRQVLADSMSKNLDLVTALWATVRAPSLVLLPALVGMRDQAWVIPGAIAAISTVVVLALGLILSARGRQGPLALAGISLILGGYLLTYATRARPGDLWIFEVSRYHLFPQIGLVCLIVATCRPLLGRLERRRTGGWVPAILFATLLACVQYRGMRLAAEGPYRFLDQPHLIAAAKKLEEIADREAIPLDQLFRTLEPIQPRWAPHPWPFHPILFLIAKGPAQSRQTDLQARAAIVAALSIEEREFIFGCMDATKYGIPAPDATVRQPASTAQLVATSRLVLVTDGVYDVRGGPAYLEFRVNPGADDARALGLTISKADSSVEIWWADESGAWSPDRSIRWKTDPRTSTGEWEVPIDAFPHWRRGSVRRLRIVARDEGILSAAPPRFLR